ncbi:hypothetical protein [Streptomyces sp. MAI_2237]
MTEGYLSVLAGAAAEWDRLASTLSAEARASLARHLRASRAEFGPQAREQALAAAAALLRPLLTGAGERLGTVPVVPGFTAADLAVLVLDGHRMVGPVLGTVRDRLLAEPALEEAEVRARGGDPGVPGLIRLRGIDGRHQLPLFQFEPEPAHRRGHALRSRVQTVNSALGVADDPWGVADWWLSPNAWLGGARPAALLGQDDEERIDEAAHCLTELEGD